MVILMVDIPNSAIDRILRKGGAKRVSKSAIRALQKELEEYGEKIATIGCEISSHAGKKTIEGEDIVLAIRKMKMRS